MTPQDAAHQILGLGLSQLDQMRMAVLAGKRQNGTVSDAEAEELKCFQELSHLLDISHVKARSVLNQRDPNA
jgi:hypothetical protein